MKFVNDKTLLKLSLYIIGTAVAIYIAFEIIGNIQSILQFLWHLFLTVASLFKPLIIALVITWLFYPLVSMIERLLTKKRIFKKKRQDAQSMSLS